MSRGMSFGIGAGGVSVLAALLAASPAVRGDADTKTNQEEPRREKKVDRRVQVLLGGGSHLGVRLEDVDQDDMAKLKLPEEKGALVKHVEEDSPAAKAGLREGDVIVRYHGESVIGASQLARLVRETPSGRTVPIEVVRGGSVQRLSATVGGGGDRAGWSFEGDLPDFDMRLPEPPEPPEAPHPPMPPMSFDRWGKRALLDDFAWFGRGPRKLGLEYQEISGQLAKYFKLNGDTGVLVTSVEAEGPAGKAGLRAGDVIVQLDTRTIDDGDDLRRAVANAEPGREITVTVLRDGSRVDLKLTPEGERRKVREGAPL